MTIDFAYQLTPTDWKAFSQSDLCCAKERAKRNRTAYNNPPPRTRLRKKRAQEKGENGEIRQGNSEGEATKSI